MRRHHTTRLMYKRYTHVLGFIGDDGPRVLEWADREIPRQFRRHTRNHRDGRSRLTSIFCNGWAFSRILDGCGYTPIDVRIPIDARAENLLLNGIRIDIRERPYWDRYRYAMHFWTRKGDGNTNGDLMMFIGRSLGPPIDRGYRVVRSRYFPAVYLSCESQLAMLRMSEPPDRVISTTVVYTHDEVRDTIR